MFKPYNYQLAKGSKKYHCPQCSKKRFVPYMDNSTNEIINSSVGRCDREVKCGYHLKPKDYFDYQPQHIETKHYQPKTTFINQPFLTKTLKRYNENNLVAFLNHHFNKDVVEKTILNYQVGTSKRWSGATVFWQIDRLNRIRTGKIMQYNSQTGKRVKEPYAKIDWVHSVLNKKKLITTNFQLKQCLFGEHLLLQQESLNKVVAIVESEKTALVMAITYPKYLWLACGSLSNINSNLFQPIKTKRIILFPDKGCFNKWNEKAMQFSTRGFNISVSLILEESTLTCGSDLADLFFQNNIGTHLFETPNKHAATKCNHPIHNPIHNQVENTQQQSLNKLIAVNPAIQNLIDRFDLVLE